MFCIQVFFCIWFWRNWVVISSVSTQVLLCLFPGVLWLWHFQYSVGPHPVSSLHIYIFVVSRAFMAGAASQAGDTDSSRAPGLTSGLQGSVNVHRGALLLVPQWQCISSFVFYISYLFKNVFILTAHWCTINCCKMYKVIIGCFWTAGHQMWPVLVRPWRVWSFGLWPWCPAVPWFAAGSRWSVWSAWFPHGWLHSASAVVWTT